MDALRITPVKVILLLLLVVTAAARAASSDPGHAALDFLEKVRQRTINLEPGGDTALSPQTAPEKKSQIARRLGRLARDLGDDPLEIGVVKLDETFAAVLVRKTGSFDPRQLQVFPVALVRHDGGWQAAPVPASFENAGVGYTIPLKKRLTNLEDWMLRQQIVELEKLRAESTSRMRERIETRLTENDLRRYSASEVADHFLAACQQKDTLTVLGLVGGLATPLPEDWLARLKAVDLAMTTQVNAAQPWRLLTAPEVVRLRIGEKLATRRSVISLAYLDPAGRDKGSERPRIQTTTLSLTQSKNGLWQVDLPTHLLSSTQANPDDADLELINTFPAKWTQAHPPTPQASAMLTQQALISALGNATLPALLRLSKLPPNPENARHTLTEAALIWWRLHAPSVVCHAIPLGFQAHDSRAVAMFGFVSARDPDQLEIQALYLEKSALGWLWNPSPTPALSDPFQEWVSAQIHEWSGKWQQTLFAESPVVAKPGELPPPAAEEARKCLTAWLDTIHRGDLPSSLKLTARLDPVGSTSTVLKNLGYEIASARQNTSPPEITRIHSGKTWTAVGVKIQEQGKLSFPLYLVVSTLSGPRLLAEVDLIATGNQSRDFLNRTAIQRLEGHASPDALAELRELHSQHQADVADPNRKLPP
jgi:hypothetical protein